MSSSNQQGVLSAQSSPTSQLVNDVGRIAREACSSIAQHYSDPIHYGGSNDARGGKSTDTGENYDANKSLPYFDSILGNPMPDLPPFCNFWFRRLTEETSQITCNVGDTFFNNDGKNDPIDKEKISGFHVARELVCNYISAIHPLVSKRGRNSHGDDVFSESSNQLEIPLDAIIEVVYHYELLIAHFARDFSDILPSARVNSSTRKNTNLEQSESTMNEKICQNLQKTKVSEISANASHKPLSVLGIGKTIHVIATELTQWSSTLPKENKDRLWKIRNKLLPCLLRLMEHAVTVLHFSTIIDEYHDSDAAVVNEVLSIATIAATPFIGDGKTSSGSFGIGALLQWILGESIGCRAKENSYGILSLAYTLQSCSISPMTCAGDFETKGHKEYATLLSDSVASNDFLTRPVIDWSVQSAHVDASWTDGVSGVGSRTAMALLLTICKASCIITGSPAEEKEFTVGTETNSEKVPLLLRKIAHNIGTNVLAATARAQFFGRLEFPSTSPGQPTGTISTKTNSIGPFMPMVTRIGTVSKKSSSASKNDEKSYSDQPIRMNAAVIIFCLVYRDIDKLTSCGKAFSYTLPVMLSLMDDVRSINQALGALMLLSFVEASSRIENNEIPSFIENSSSIITKSLENAIQLSSRQDATFLTTICLAHSEWLRLLFNWIPLASKSSLRPTTVHAWMSKAASDNLVAVRKQVQMGGKDKNDELIVGALVAGIDPLLADLASLPNAATIEIARVGLSAILPLIGWRGMSMESRSIQIAALAGLLSLLSGAYPIMTHHGTKIMTEVLILLDRSDKDAIFMRDNDQADKSSDKLRNDELSTESVVSVALHAAAATLVICDKGADTVLSHVQKHGTLQYKRVSQIRNVGEKLQNYY